MATKASGELERFDTAADLWPQLVLRAGLTGSRDTRPGPYDADLLDDLRERLFPGDVGDITTLIATSALSAETLLRAFFATLLPFAAMKEDILAMLSEAGARASGDSLRIRFNFDTRDGPLDLLLEHFRSQMEAFAPVDMSRMPSIGYADLWQLARAGLDDYPDFSYNPGSRTGPTDVLDWIGVYNDGASFAALPGGWQTGNAEVDDRLDRVVALMNALLARFERYGRSHDELRRAAGDGGKDKPDDSGFSVYELWLIESDFWPRAIGAWICQVHDVLASRDRERLARICARVDEILPASAGKAKVLACILEDVLDMPVWKHRHAVYAVWLGAQLFNGLSGAGWRFRFHLVEDRLEFTFRGVHLATMRRHAREPELYWWTELRTDHSDLPSGHRTTGIQPDYRVLASPLSRMGGALLVLEAKQHLRSSNKEFRQAIEDYAHACPRAGIFLANHGPCSKRLLSKVKAAARARCAAYGDMQPGHPDSIALFRRDLVTATDCALDEDVAQAFLLSYDIQLTWGTRPADLDLHLFRRGGGHAYYGHRLLDGVTLGPDAQTGHGPETARLRAATGIHSVVVHCYSEDGDLASSDAVVEIASGQGTERASDSFNVPSGKGRYWHVADIDCANRVVTPVELIRNDWPN